MQSTLIPYFAAGLAFVSVLLAGYGILGYLGGAGDSARLRDRLSGSVGRNVTPSSPFDELRRMMSRLFERMGSKIAPTDAAEVGKNRLALLQAGLRTPGASLKFQGIKGMLAISLLGLFLALRFLVMKDMSVVVTCFLTVAMATIGVYGPEFWLRRRITKRQLTVSDELPDALDLLVVCVESGMGLDQAIERVCEETRTSGPVFSAELKLLTLELRAGKGRGDALRALSERVGLDDLNSLTSLLIQADVFGISVGRTLRVYSDAMRTKRSQRAEEKAAKLPVLLLLPLITFILPALFAAIMGPAIILFIDVFAKIKM